MAKLSEVKATENAEVKTEAEATVEANTEAETTEVTQPTVDLQSLEANWKAEELKLTDMESNLQSGKLSVDEIIKTSTEILKLRENVKKLNGIYTQAKLESVKAQIEAEILPILAKYEVKRILVENFSYVTEADGKETTVSINRFKLNTDVEAFVPTWSRKAKVTTAKAQNPTANTENGDFKYTGSSRVEYRNTTTGETVKASDIFNQQSDDFRKSQFGTAMNGSWNRVLESAHKLNILTEYEVVKK